MKDKSVLVMINELGEIYRDSGILDDRLEKCKRFSRSFPPNLVMALGLPHGDDPHGVEELISELLLVGEKGGGDDEMDVEGDDGHHLVDLRCLWLEHWGYWRHRVDGLNVIEALDKMTDRWLKSKDDDDKAIVLSREASVLSRIFYWVIVHQKEYGKCSGIAGDDDAMEGDDEEKWGQQKEEVESRLIRYVNKYGIWGYDQRLEGWRLWNRKVSCGPRKCLIHFDTACNMTSIMTALVLIALVGIIGIWP